FFLLFFFFFSVFAYPAPGGSGGAGGGGPPRAPPPAALLVSGRPAPSRHRTGADRLRDDRALLAKVRSLGGTGAGLLDDPDLRELVLPVLRSDYGALAAYRPTVASPLSCPVVGLTGENDTEAAPEEVSAWAAHTTGSFALRSFPGGHFFLTDHLADVADLVTGLAVTARALRP
ncbi:thioesterase II family protein, partial [Streptomyces sp. NPDC004788]